MIRHISVFTLVENAPNGKTKQENIETICKYLETVPELYPVIVNSQVGVSIGGDAPDLPEGAAPIFGDIVQILDFHTVEDANGYPPSKAHTNLVEFSNPMLDKVTAIDFEF